MFMSLAATSNNPVVVRHMTSPWDKLSFGDVPNILLSRRFSFRSPQPKTSNATHNVILLQDYLNAAGYVKFVIHLQKKKDMTHEFEKTTK